MGTFKISALSDLSEATQQVNVRVRTRTQKFLVLGTMFEPLGSTLSSNLSLCKELQGLATATSCSGYFCYASPQG